MFSFSLWTILRFTIGLVIGVFVAYKSRYLLQNLIIRLLPVSYRMQEHSYRMQNRLYYALLTMTAFGIMLLFHWGVNRVTQALGWDKVTDDVINNQGVLSNPPQEYDLTYPPVVTVPRPSPQQPIAEPKQEVQTFDRLPNVMSSPAPEIQRERFVPKFESRTVVPSEPQVTYFIQLNAFADLQKARKHRLSWASRTPYHCYIGVRAEDMSPYKVLLGPFAGREAAEAYRKRNRIKGFPKAQNPQLLIYSE
jgi:hypothetical protein